jgi:hypothetical protein
VSPLELVVDGSRVTEKALTFPDQARRIVIADPQSYEHACDFLKGIKALRDEIAETFDSHIRRAHEAHKALLKEKQDAEAPLAEAERIAKDALVAYNREQDRLRREEEARRREQARLEEEERRLAEAIELEEAGRAMGDVGMVAEAAELLEAPISVPVVAVASSTPKVSGIAYRETWSARVTDLKALVKYVAANPQFANLLTANTTALNAQARSLKGALAIPGVEAVATRDVAAGRR